MSLASEFKSFVARGNVLDLAVGVVIGAAFGKIVTSLVDQIIMPPIGLAIGGIDFSNLKWVLRAAAESPKATEVAIQYGSFLNTMIQFAIIAFAIFLVVKLVNRAMPKAPPGPPEPPAQEKLLVEIRDLLKQQYAQK
jgi:large conductance mechanosensitive channel